MLTDKLPHGWQVLATLFAVASVFTLCWYLSQKGLLDLAATGLSFFIMTLSRHLAPSFSQRAPNEFKATATLLDQARADFDKWMKSRKLLSLVVISFAYTVLFLIVRYTASLFMAFIASPWLALAIGLALAACVASPVLVREVTSGFKKRLATPKAE